MFRYAWIILIGVPYVIWTVLSVLDIYKSYLENKDDFDLVIDTEDYTTFWMGLTSAIIIVVGLISFIIYVLTSINS